MNAVIKVDLEAVIREGGPVILELGCGPNKQSGRIGIDRLDLPGVDIVADLEKGLPFIPDASVDEIHSKSFLEHVDDFEFLMTEIIRVLKKDGLKHLFVPHFSNPYFYSDFTHKRFFGLYTFHYFAKPENQMRRKVPDFYNVPKIRVVSQRLVFRSPFRVRNKVKRVLERIFNCHPYMQEFYEENLCHIFPCYGIQVVLTPDK
jgi:SAM-dependent methyltransferase